MCGIAGIFPIHDHLYDFETQHNIVSNMISTIRHRGPDGSGVWVEENAKCTLGHRRLSIIDTSDAGLQPMSYNHEEWTITFNGEIYNYQELRNELTNSGATIVGKTDTEVLLSALSVWGIEAVNKFDGMFAFAAYHSPTETLYLTRDPFGEKPLYYTKHNNKFIAFSSELTSLETLPDFTFEVDENSISELLMFQYIGAPRSIYKNVSKLPQGHWLKINKNGDMQTNKYYEFRPGSNGFSNKDKTVLADELEDILITSIKRRLISDVPLGAFLSGGVDSSTVCGIAKKNLGIDLNTYSIGFDGYSGSEHEIARKIAAHLGTNHKDKLVVPNLKDFLNNIGNLLDEPNGDSSCLPTFILTRFAREEVTVAISGDGGDELFGGYGRYTHTLAQTSIRHNNLSAGCHYYNSNNILVFNPGQLQEFLGFMPKVAADHLSSLIAKINNVNRELLCNLRSSDVENYLPGAVLAKVDRMSMRNSMEVRTPFLNLALANFAEKLPPRFLIEKNKTKVLLKEVAYRYIPKNIIDLPKQGFGLPVNTGWGKQQILYELNAALDKASVLRSWIGDFRTDKFLNDQNSKDKFSIYQVWSVIVLENWLRSRPVKMPTIHESKIIKVANDVTKHIGCNVDSKHSVTLLNENIVIVGLGQINESSYNVLEFSKIKHILKMRNILSDDHIKQNANNIIKPSLKYIGDLNDNLVGAISFMETHREILRGKEMLFLDSEYKFKFEDLVPSLMALGVKRYIVPNRNVFDQWIDYHFNSTSSLVDKETLDFLEREQNDKVLIVCGNELNSLIKEFTTNNLLNNEEEHSLKFAFIANGKQVVPYIYSHKEIEESLYGRYSIWNGALKCSHNMYPDYIVYHGDDSCKLPISASEFSLGNFSKQYFITSLSSIPKTKTTGLKSKDKPNIFVYTHGLTAGGAERQWCNLTIGLQQLGHNVTLVVDSYINPHSSYDRIIRDAGVRVVALDSLKDTCKIKSFSYISEHWSYLELFTSGPFDGSLLEFVHLMEVERPDIVFSQLDYPNIQSSISAIIAKVPSIVISFRNYNPTHFPHFNTEWFHDAYQKLIQNHSIQLTGNSKLGNLDYAAWLNVDPEQIQHIPNSYEHNDFKNLPTDLVFFEKFKSQNGIKSDAKIIIGAFRLSDEKQPEIFIDVCNEIAQKCPNVCFIICGDGPKRSKVENYIKTKGLDKKIILLGNVDNLNELMSISDILLHTAKFEGMPNVIVEALYQNCPIVATSVGAIPELITHGVNGFIAEVGDITAMSNYCCLILNSKETLQNNQSEEPRLPKLYTHYEMASMYISAAFNNQ
jgi:asparagine synthase (glutamine-hydrolysing)